jgi:serine/threonine protein kinase/formylglycine-generating enzyme required for sulfatase activity
MSSQEQSDRARSLLTSFLREHPRADTTAVQAFAAKHPEDAREITRIFAEFEEFRKLDDSPDGTRSIESVSIDLDLDRSVEANLAANLPRKTDVARRYRIDGEIGHGGMGSILKVWDNDLHRFLAMKVSLAKSASRGNEVAEQLDSGKLARFLEEAQITGQLDHPGIVPVHELGLDEHGRVFFTMKLVKGRTLKEVFEEHKRGEEDWTLPRVLGLLLKVCEAMAYAHDKGVVHRDLKPINVMIGRYGEVYVMDWGLAKVLRGTTVPEAGKPDEDDLATRSELDTLRLRETSDETQSPLWTAEGNVVGTPPFMAPEQALEETAAIGPQVDVYALGAILYQLLSGRLPYVDPGARYNAYVTWLMVRTGPPRPVAEIAPDRPAELIAICEKAMARDRARRYPNMAALAEDLRAFLEGRVVRAFETGPWADARKWIVRNRALAAALTVGVLGLAGGLVYSQIQKARATRNESVAIEQRTKVLQLSIVKQLEDLRAEADQLYPIAHSRIPAMQRWIDKARGLHDHLDELERDLDQLREHARSGGALTGPPDPNIVLAGVATSKAPGGIQPVSNEEPWVFDDEPTQWYHDTLAGLVDDLSKLVDPDPKVGGIARISQRIERAQIAYETSTEDPDAQSLWKEAIASIRNRGECPAYAGLTISPQEGLLPIGRDPHSGLWEFSHLASGEPLLREADGSLVPLAESGIVLVLLPSGIAHIGGQKRNPGSPDYDPWATAEDTQMDPRNLSMDAFFCSKYEVTQAQWLRMADSNPSALCPEDRFRPQRFDVEPFTLLHPVEQVSWYDCVDLCAHYHLALPTSEQWEYAARAGARTPFTTGSTAASLEGAANIDDLTSKASTGRTWELERQWKALAESARNGGENLSEGALFDDHWCFTAPIGTFRPNAFGLHDVHGNVAEWCWNPTIYGVPDFGDLVLSSFGEGNNVRPFAGGSYGDPPSRTRLCTRGFASPSSFQILVGLRVIRVLDP